MQSKAATVAEYIASLPDDRRRAIEAVRKVILENLDPDIDEVMSYGMIGYAVPHRVYPPGYHCDPSKGLPYAGLASQKQYMSLYVTWMYGNPAAEAAFRKQWEASGRKLDMGKCCIRFKKLDDLALDIIADMTRRTTAASYVAHYEKNLESAGIKHPGKKAAGAKSATPTASKPAAKRSARKKTAKKVATKKIGKVAKKTAKMKSARR
jgi:hypothetical protein